MSVASFSSALGRDSVISEVQLPVFSSVAVLDFETPETT